MLQKQLIKKKKKQQPSIETIEKKINNYNHRNKNRKMEVHVTKSVFGENKHIKKRKGHTHNRKENIEKK